MLGPSKSGIEVLPGLWVDYLLPGTKGRSKMYVGSMERPTIQSRAGSPEAVGWTRRMSRASHSAHALNLSVAGEEGQRCGKWAKDQLAFVLSFQSTFEKLCPVPTSK